MRSSRPRCWCCLSILLVAYGMLVPPTALAQAWREAEEQTKRLVVMITAGVNVGAGIVYGLDKDGIYIATAHHLVGNLRDTDKIAVSFYKQTDRTFPAEMLTPYDDELDLAVVRVRREAALEPQLLDLSFDRLADLSLLRRGSQVYLLGNPKGKTWRINIQPELLAEVRGDLLEFESRLIDGGHSGGALLTDHRHIAGMLKGSNPPYGEAVAIDRISTQLAAWGYPIHLHAPLPRLSTGWGIACHVKSSGETSCWEAMGGFTPPISSETGRFHTIAIGLEHTCSIDMEGKALCMGANKYGQIGMGTTSERQESFVPVLGDLTFQAISAGGWHTCGLDQDGRAYCWGAGTGGRLGNDSGENASAPVAVASILRFKSIAAGLRHTCGLTIDGEAYCWGGILGSGAERYGPDLDNAWLPLRLGSGLRFRSISAGGDLSCAVAINGDGYCWGSSEAANVRAPLSKAEPLAPTIPIVRVAGRLKFQSISAGLRDHACGLTVSNRLYCWGGNKYGQLGDGTTADSIMPVPVSLHLLFDSVSTGVAYTCGVTFDGATYCWGRRGQNAAHSTAVPMQVAALGESPARARRRQAPLVDIESPQAIDQLDAAGIVRRYIQALGGAEEIAKIQGSAWQGTIAYPMFGLLERRSSVAEVEAVEQPQGGYTFRASVPEYGAVTVKSANGERTVSPALEHKHKHPYLEEPFSALGEFIDRDVFAWRDALSYAKLFVGEPRVRAKGRSTVEGTATEVLELERDAGRLDTLHFDAATGLLIYFSAAPKEGARQHEVYLRDYRQVGGLKAPFELTVNTPHAQSVVKMHQLRLQ